MVSDRQRKEAVKEFRDEHENYKQYVLAELRIARKRAALLVEEIDHIGKYLGLNVIDCSTALAWLSDAKALEFLRPTEPATSEEETNASS